MDENISDSPVAHGSFGGEISQHDTAGSIICAICQKQFSRPEHLRRHAQIHRQEKPHGCNHCSKTFSRKDAAKRHRHIHEPAKIAVPTTHSDEALCRTCSACAKSRVKCSGGSPCNYCATRDLECTYPSRKRRRRLQELTSEEAELPASLASLTRSGALEVSGVNDADALYSIVNDNHTLQHDDSRESEHMVQQGDLSQAEDQYVGRALRSGASEISPDLDTTFTEVIPPSGHERPRVSESWHQELTATNWLPFDDSSLASNPSPSVARPIQQEYGIVLASPHEPELNIDWSSALDNDITTQHDRFSELINSMGNCLPGFLDFTDNTNLLIDSREVTPGAFYSNGAGSRASQPEKYMMNRRSRLELREKSNVDQQSTVSPWVQRLEQRINAGSKEKSVGFNIPGAVHLELLSKTCPSPEVNLLSSRRLGNIEILNRKEALEYFIHLYFENFHALYPFMDKSLLCIPVWGWALCLATAAVGARYVNIPDVTIYGDDLCNTVHEILLKELDLGNVEDSLPYVQARALAAVGLCHSGNPELMNRGYNAIALVSNSCLRLRLLEEDDRIGSYQQGQTVEQVWIAWRFRETRRRTGLFIWLMDGGLASMAMLAPRIPLKVLNLKSPSNNDLWKAETCQAWLEAHQHQHRPGTDPQVFNHEDQSRLSIQDAIRNLRRNRQIPEDLPELSTITIIQALTCRLWDMKRFVDDLASSGGLEEHQSSIVQDHTSNIQYPSSVPEYVKWRNSTCDHLDVLHWEALSMSARSGGLERPTFLQLHLARLLILAPAKEILDYVFHSTQPAMGITLPQDLYNVPETLTKCNRTLGIWVQKDRYKARLAVIHAGAVFWHIRRYSADVPVQAFAVFLAAVTLWAFGSFSNSLEARRRATSITTRSIAVSSSDGISPSRSEDILHNHANQINSDHIEANISSRTSRAAKARMPNFMQLDRPMDDELVQHFIRHGETMRLHLEGVNDLVSTDGPGQVLREAINILDEASQVWSIAENYALRLDALARSITSHNTAS